MIQGSPEWLAVRCGKVTASRVADLLAKTKTGWGASRANYMAELIAERLTGIPAESYSSAAMKWGTDTESYARQAYQFYSEVEVIPVAFVVHPSVSMAGASPDGLIGDDGLVEIKCPNTATHIDTLLGGTVPGKYVTQMQWQMACTDRDWCDFVSFDPRMPESMRTFIQRVQRDKAFIGQTEAAVEEFIAELNKKVAALRSMYEGEELAA